MTISKYAFAITVLISSFVFHAGMAHAQIVWDNTTGSPDPWFDIGSNWVGGVAPGATDDAEMSMGGNYEVWWDGTTASTIPTVKTLSITGGVGSLNIDFVNQDSTQHVLNVAGPGFGGTVFDLGVFQSTLTLRGIHLRSFGGANTENFGSLVVDGAHSAGSQFTVTGSSGFRIGGNLTVQAGGQVTTTHSRIGNIFNGTALVTGAGSSWANSGNLTIGGDPGVGELRIESEGHVSNFDGIIGFGAGRGFVFVEGTGSSWSSANGIYVGESNDGSLMIESGGVVSSSFARIGDNAGVDGATTVNGIGSRLDVSGMLEVGVAGNGQLTIESGGVVNTLNSRMGSASGGVGTVNISGANSEWNVSGDLEIAPVGAGTLNISNGLVSVSSATSIGTSGTVNLTGGRFEFAETTLAEFDRINATGGFLAGNVTHDSYTDASTLSGLQNREADLGDVNVLNSGVLYGNASITAGLNNGFSGEINVVSGERMRFGGHANVNEGEINSFDGQVRFDQQMFNFGFISGRGQFIADGGWVNGGVMAFSGGFADVLGDVDNTQGGQIVTAGGGTTTFYDDVVHEGLPIHTEIGSRTVFFGSATGSGAFTGLGDVFYEGDFRPGSSPGILTYEGNVIFGPAATTHIEIFGAGLGDFDQLDIAGNLNLQGLLQVEFGNGFELGLGQEFLIADIDGILTGEFFGFGEGDLIGNFAGNDLYISYSAGDGNDVALFSLNSVPEPTAMIFAGFCFAGLLLNRRKGGLRQN